MRSLIYITSDVPDIYNPDQISMKTETLTNVIVLFFFPLFAGSQYNIQ